MIKLTNVSFEQKTFLVTLKKISGPDSMPEIDISEVSFRSYWSSALVGGGAN